MTALRANIISVQIANETILLSCAIVLSFMSPLPVSGQAARFEIGFQACDGLDPAILGVILVSRREYPMAPSSKTMTTTSAPPSPLAPYILSTKKLPSSKLSWW